MDRASIVAIRLPSLISDELVPNAPDGLEVAGGRLIVTGFLPNAGNIQIDIAVVSVVGRMVQFEKNFIAGDDTARLL